MNIHSLLKWHFLAHLILVMFQRGHVFFFHVPHSGDLSELGGLVRSPSNSLVMKGLPARLAEVPHLKKSQT